jgi:ribose 5-phosphate isomerase B
MSQRIIIGNDHGGYDAKVEVVKHLATTGVEIVDAGSDSTEIVRYPYYARKVAGAVARGEFDGGILICSTGIGMAIAANKVKGIRASVCTSRYMAKMTRQHNDSNVLCLGEKITGIFEILEIVDAWLENEFIGDRHAISLGLIRAFEEEQGLRIPEDRPIPDRTAQ